MGGNRFRRRARVEPVSVAVIPDPRREYGAHRETGHAADHQPAPRTIRHLAAGKILRGDGLSHLAIIRSVSPKDSLYALEISACPPAHCSDTGGLRFFPDPAPGCPEEGLDGRHHRIHFPQRVARAAL